MLQKKANSNQGSVQSDQFTQSGDETLPIIIR